MVDESVNLLLWCFMFVNSGPVLVKCYCFIFHLKTHCVTIFSADFSSSTKHASNDLLNTENTFSVRCHKCIWMTHLLCLKIYHLLLCWWLHRNELETSPLPVKSLSCLWRGEHLQQRNMFIYSFWFLLVTFYTNKSKI